MPTDVFACLLLLTTFAASWYNWWKAMGHLVFDSEDHYWHVMMLGGFASREHFTDEGWEYRNRSLVLTGAFAIYCVVPIWLSA